MQNYVYDTYSKLAYRYVLMDRIIKTCNFAKNFNLKNNPLKETDNISVQISTPLVNDIIQESASTEIIENNQPITPPRKVENKLLKEKYNLAYQRYQKENNSRVFQVYNVFKTKIKRMYRVDCMTRKLNV